MKDNKDSVIESFRQLVNEKGVPQREKEAAFWELVTTKPDATQLHQQALVILQKRWPSRGKKIATQYRLRDIKKQ